jgi:fido (protein-threonine AMPylation protein)
MTRPYTGNCPEWSSDGPETREGTFRASVAAAYRAAAAAAKRRIADSPTCRDWHRTLFTHHVPLDYYAGNYRQIDPLRPCLQTDVRVEGTPGAPYQTVVSEMERLFDHLRRYTVALELDWPELSPQERAKRLAIILGTMIGRFIQVHPFINGNGRLSRLLWAWGLLRFGVPPQFRVRQRPDHPDYTFIMNQAMQGNFGHLAVHIFKHLTHHAPEL